MLSIANTLLPFLKPDTLAVHHSAIQVGESFAAPFHLLTAKNDNQSPSFLPRYFKDGDDLLRYMQVEDEVIEAVKGHDAYLSYRRYLPTGLHTLRIKFPDDSFIVYEK